MDEWQRAVEGLPPMGDRLSACGCILQKGGPGRRANVRQGLGNPLDAAGITVSGLVPKTDRPTNLPTSVARL